MHPKLMAVFSALNAGVLGALMVAYSNAPVKLVGLAFGVQFCKSLQDIFTTPPGDENNQKGNAADVGS